MGEHSASSEHSASARLGRRSWRRRLAPAFLATAISVGFTATASAAPKAKSEPAKSEPVVLEARNAKLGTVLVTAKGFTLYRYTLDRVNHIACTSVQKCTAFWPPLVLPADVTTPTGGKGVSDLGTIRDPNGRLQVTYKGHPLYRFAGDAKPGTAKGQGVEGTWFAVSPSVARLTSTQATTSPPISPPTTTVAPTTTTTSVPPTTTTTLAPVPASATTVAPSPPTSGYGY